jgi:hypothetical protein
MAVAVTFTPVFNVVGETLDGKKIVIADLTVTAGNASSGTQVINPLTRVVSWFFSVKNPGLNIWNATMTGNIATITTATVADGTGAVLSILAVGY